MKLKVGGFHATYWDISQGPDPPFPPSKYFICGRKMRHADEASLSCSCLSGVHGAVGGNVDTEGLGQVVGGCAVATGCEGSPATADSAFIPNTGHAQS